MFTLKQKALWFALLSRIFVIVVQGLFNALIPDHEAQDVFVRPIPPSLQTSVSDKIVDFFLGGLERWDAQYFLHIAENGYVYENTLAFFPFFPLALRCISSCLNVVTLHVLNRRSLLLLASTILNTTCFIKTADILFDLSMKVLRNEALAYKAALLFCINPASIFFSAPYSEAMFALLTFHGMSSTLSTQHSRFSAIPFGLAAATRSNGVLNVGFIVYASIRNFFVVKWPNLIAKQERWRKFLLPLNVFSSFRPMIESCIVSLAPFIAYQGYCYLLFCTSQKLNIAEHLIRFGISNNFVMPDSDVSLKRSSSHWCYYKVPLAYSYVQNHYWNVGFLQYYEFKQIPNFLLAAPIILLIISQTYVYFREHRSLCYRLGLVAKASNRKYEHSNHFMSPEMFVFVVHAFLLTLFCLIFVHIQVATRMICSSSPVPYWYAAYLISYNKSEDTLAKHRGGGVMLVTRQMTKLNSGRITCKNDCVKMSHLKLETLHNMHSRWKVILLTELPENGQGRLIVIYFLLYTIVGTILFSNFLPWT